MARERIDAAADLPMEAPLAMPVQDFYRTPRPAPAFVPSAGLWRRGFLIVGSGIIGFMASIGIADGLAGDGYDAVDQVIAILSLSLFAWIGFGFLNAIVGLIVSIGRRHRRPAPTPFPSKPVAVLIPVYNEDISAVGARIARMAEELRQGGAAALFHFFVLSDSQVGAEASERAACQLLRKRDGCPIFYRRRMINHGRKPGNIAEWVKRFGAAYESMIVLDADSRMSGEVMLRLAGDMEADPKLGLIQTNPQLTAGETLFARWQQFAAALYGPISSAGLKWWSGDEATFWGHNAILRVSAFAESCGLPALPGREPLGGVIMSHDMVEAALLRRRGWRARMMLLSEGSYEECPPTMIDHGIRDRRWCQGNLQHLRLLDAAGLHWVSRLQLLMGASAYLTSPLWLFLLTVALLQSIRVGAPVLDHGTPMWLLVGTLLLLFGNKMLALIWAAFDRKLVVMLGGWRAIFTGLLVDVPLSVLAAPIIMASQCLAILEIMTGRPSGWAAQRREANNVSIIDAFDHYRWHVLLGLPFLLVTMDPSATGLWNLPVALGLLGAPLLVAATSRADWGARAARFKLFSGDPGEQPSALLAGAEQPRPATTALV